MTPAPLSPSPSHAGNADLGAALLSHARAAIHSALTGETLAVLDHPQLEERGATFVTLTAHRSLRGCIGSLIAHRPLKEDVRANALAAAFRDPRFPPLTAVEWPSVAIEVSLLSSPEPIAFAAEEDLLRQLRPGIDGLTITLGTTRATFLPQVWAQIPQPADFLAALKRKAGLDPQRRYPGLTAERYTVTAWHEAIDPPAP
ncbi:MAG: AmmeMemoRadiSam system protein A [Hydrogenophilus sp.]|nr:AmmeMemoRadiSam system protein A [Hydrogenophilus sp.]